MALQELRDAAFQDGLRKPVKAAKRANVVRTERPATFRDVEVIRQSAISLE